MAKLYASEAAHRAVHAAVQVLGAAGYAKPNAVERAAGTSGCWRSTRAARRSSARWTLTSTPIR
ncbi:MAG: hypothetical protein L0K86_16005 [Actinomycetia bacterium]|nr:hypothetical protein [Actinomycetes bacterium]